MRKVDFDQAHEGLCMGPISLRRSVRPSVRLFVCLSVRLILIDYMEVMCRNAEPHKTESPMIAHEDKRVRPCVIY